MPSASEAVAARLAAGPVRIAGAGTKRWGRRVAAEALSTRELTHFSHEAGDFTAVLGAGVPLRDAQARFSEHGQMLALDPPADAATIGGVVATADSGPLRHRYGAPRDLVIGMTLALPDGSVARSGGRVIKNVAGYDLPKLAAGSFGTLGVITEVCVRLHPKPEATATAIFHSDDPHELQRTAIRLNNTPLEAECLDLNDRAVLVRFGGPRATQRAIDTGGEVLEDDDELWAAQRAGQRGALVLRVHALPTEIARVLGVAREFGATVVGRAGVGTFWLKAPPATDPEHVRAALQPHPVVVTDAPRPVDDPWDVPDGPEKTLMEAVRRRFDPDRHCNPGI